MSGRQGIDLTKSEAQQTIDRQIEVYHKISESSHRLLRLILTIIAVIVALSSALASGLLKLIPKGESKLQYTEHATEAEITEAELAIQYAELMGISIILIAALLFCLSGYKAIISISYPELYPALGSSENMSVSIRKGDDVDSSQYSTWLRKNSENIYNAKSDLKDGYEYFYSSILIAILGPIVYSLGYFARIDVIYNLSYVITVISIGGVIFYIGLKILGIDLSNRSVSRRADKLDWLTSRTVVTLLLFPGLLYLLPVVIFAIEFQGVGSLIQGSIVITAGSILSLIYLQWGRLAAGVSTCSTALAVLLYYFAL